MNSPDSTLAAQPKTSALALLASRFSVDANKLLETLKNTVFKGATNDELLALVVVSNEYGLNPLTKEIYAFPAKGGGIVPVVSIDGWLRMMNDHPQFDGMEYEWQHDGERLIACTAVIHRKDRSHPVRVTEYMAECRRNTEPWKMEHRMLRHKATIQCARVAFGFSGIVDEEEAPGIPGLARDVTPPKAEESKLFQHDAKKEAPAFALDDSTPSPRETFMAKFQALGVPWEKAHEALFSNGVLNDVRATPADCADGEITMALRAWPQLEMMVKGGSPK